MNEQYLEQLQKFVELIRTQQNNTAWTFEFGRKYDKITLDKKVRYFVERTTGNIYGARSNTTPHLQWRFGNLNRCHLWDFSSYHPNPVNDPSVRMIGKYGPYIRYISDEDG